MRIDETTGEILGDGNYQVMPPLSETEYNSLKAQVARDGVLVPIEYDEDGNVLDGFHRLKACEELGITSWPSITRLGLTETEKRTHARTINANRRHLNREQKQELVRAQLRDTPEWSNRRIAQVVGVNHKTVKPIREGLESTGEIPQLDKLTGADGKQRPAEMPEQEPQPEMGGLFNRTEVDRKNKADGVKALQENAPDLLASVADGKMTIPAANKESRRRRQEAEWEKIQGTPQPTDGDNWPIGIELLTGDFAQIGPQLAAETFDLIITDPPYGTDNVHLYGMLAEQAARLLKPGGSLLAMAGQLCIPQTLNLMTPHLNYHWTISYDTPGGQSPQIWTRKVNTFWKPVFWFVKGEYAGRWHGDKIKSDVNDNDKRFHGWGQSESGIGKLVSEFATPGAGKVLDPFLGGGTTAIVCYRLRIPFVGIDINADAIATTRKRILMEIANATS